MKKVLFMIAVIVQLIIPALVYLLPEYFNGGHFNYDYAVNESTETLYYFWANYLIIASPHFLLIVIALIGKFGLKKLHLGLILINLFLLGFKIWSMQLDGSSASFAWFLVYLPIQFLILCVLTLIFMWVKPNS